MDGLAPLEIVTLELLLELDTSDNSMKLSISWVVSLSLSLSASLNSKAHKMALTMSTSSLSVKKFMKDGTITTIQLAQSW